MSASTTTSTVSSLMVSPSLRTSLSPTFWAVVGCFLALHKIQSTLQGCHWLFNFQRHYPGIDAITHITPVNASGVHPKRTHLRRALPLQDNTNSTVVDDPPPPMSKSDSNSIELIMFSILLSRFIFHHQEMHINYYFHHYVNVLFELGLWLTLNRFFCAIVVYLYINTPSLRMILVFLPIQRFLVLSILVSFLYQFQPSRQ